MTNRPGAFSKFAGEPVFAVCGFSSKTWELRPSCGGEMWIIAFIVDQDVVDAILRHR